MTNKAVSKKKRRKESLEEVRDHLPQYFEQFVEWARNNLKIIGILLAALILIVILGGTWYNYRQEKVQQALALEAEAMELHETAQSEDMSQAQKSEAEGQEEAEEQTSNEAPYQEAREKYLELIETYPDTESAARAVYMLGSIDYEIGNYEKAQDAFTSYLEKNPEGPLAIEAELSLAYIAEQQGNHQEAIEKFQRVESKMSSTRKAEAQLAIGRNYEALQQIENAVSTYQAIVDSNTAFSWKDQARERLDLLQPEDVTAEVPAAEASPEDREVQQPAPDATAESQDEEQAAASEPDQETVPASAEIPPEPAAEKHPPAASPTVSEPEPTPEPVAEEEPVEVPTPDTTEEPASAEE